MSKPCQFYFLLPLLMLCIPSVAAVRVSDLTKLDGARENALVGYGVVIGLNGTGDSRRSQATMQSVANTLQKFGVFVDSQQISARNVSVVMVTTTLPPFTENGSKIDVTVSSIGDARSISGGTLLLAPLKAPNGEVIALAQGELSVGGYSVNANGNSAQKNHPTVGIVPGGATVERATKDKIIDQNGHFNLLLREPDFRTAKRIVNAINSSHSNTYAEVVHAGKISISTNSTIPSVAYSKIAEIQDLLVTPVSSGRIVINERTGTVIAGGDIVIDNVTISHGNFKLSITTKYNVSQPNSNIIFSENSELNQKNGGARTVVVPETNVNVAESESISIKGKSGTSVADLILSLNKMHMSSRDIITILQALSRAGALHGELIIQ